MFCRGLRGQPSNRRRPEADKQQAIALLSTEEYADFGPTLASEYLGKKRGLWISKETIRKWMTEAGLVEGASSQSGKSASVAGAPRLFRRVGAVGHQ